MTGPTQCQLALERRDDSRVNQSWHAKSHHLDHPWISGSKSGTKAEIDTDSGDGSRINNEDEDPHSDHKSSHDDDTSELTESAHDHDEETPPSIIYLDQMVER